MRRLNSREWASVAMLSIIVPVGFLITFRMIGVLREPPEPEKVRAEAVTWNMTRPVGVDIITIGEWVRNSYTDSFASVNSSVLLAEYTEDMLDWPSDGDDDVLDLGMTANANVSSGFIHSVVIRFSPMDDQSRVDIVIHPDAIELENLTTVRARSVGTNEHEALFETKSSNQPKLCSLHIVVRWTLEDRNNLNHLVTAILEVTYFNGTLYRELVLPIQLGVLLP